MTISATFEWTCVRPSAAPTVLYAAKFGPLSGSLTLPSILPLPVVPKHWRRRQFHQK